MRSRWSGLCRISPPEKETAPLGQISASSSRTRRWASHGGHGLRLTGDVTPPRPEHLLEEGVVRQAADELVEESEHRLVAQAWGEVRPDSAEQPSLEDRPHRPEESAAAVGGARGLREHAPDDVARVGTPGL